MERLFAAVRRPQICLVAQGWTIQQEQTVPITLEDGRSHYVRVLTVSRRERKSLCRILDLWYVGKDRTTEDNFRRILLTSWDRVVPRVNHRWAYVTISGFIPGDGADSKSAKQLQADLVIFTREIIPLIQRPDLNTSQNR